jgi:1-acyl-sn-glycerol-3-phosphate acyltransferase
MKLTLTSKFLMKTSAAFKWGLYFLNNAILLVLIPSIKKKFLKKSWDELYREFNLFGKIGLKIFGIESRLVNPHGVDLKQQYLIAANHRSWFDQIALMALYPKNVHFLAKADYFKVPFFKYCLNNYECIAVHNKKLNHKTSAQLDKYITRGDDVVFFVEGTRGSGRSLLPFKKGVFKQSADTGLPVLPTYILGSEQCLCKKNTLFTVKKGNVVVILGNPVYFTHENLDEQIAEFEANYRKVHDDLYVDYDKFQAQEGTKSLRPVLGFGEV